MKKIVFSAVIFFAALVAVIAVQIKVPSKNSVQLLQNDAVDTVIDFDAKDKQASAQVQAGDDQEMMIIQDEQVPLAGADLHDRANDSNVLSIKFLLLTMAVGTGVWTVSMIYKERQKNEKG